MSHQQQKDFCKHVRRKYRSHFINANIIDVGSLDINGNNRWLFRRNLYNWKGINHYSGVDIVSGKNVMHKGFAHVVLPRLEYYIVASSNQCNSKKPFWPIDVVICTEMLEHDEYWNLSLESMYKILKPGGLLLITAGGDGRLEHGTDMWAPYASPGTNHYYLNMSNDMFESVLPMTLFKDYYINQDSVNKDFQFYGIKK